MDRFSKYCKIISGYAFKAKDLTEEGDIAVIKIGNISNGGNVNINSNVQYVDKSFLSLDAKYHIKNRDILISLTGSHMNQPNSMVGRSCRSYNNKTYLLNQRAGKVIPYDNTDKDYLYYLLSSEEIKYSIVIRAYGAANQVNISPTDIERIKWDFPEYKIQCKIGNILSTYDDLIEKNNRKIEILQEMAEELYKEWFVRFRFPGYKTAKFTNGIPDGWERKKIKQYYDTCSGGTPDRSKEYYYINGTYRWIKTGEIKNNIIVDTEESITEQAINSSSAKLLPANSVIMAMYGVNIGLLGYIDGQMTCNQACCVFSDKRKFSSRHYLFYYLKSIREYLLLISFGAAQQNLSQELIKKLKIVMPSDEIIMAFEDKIEPIYQSIRNLILLNNNLKMQRDLLLPRLMSGKLEVKVS